MLNIVRLIDVAVSIRMICECSEKIFLSLREKSRLSIFLASLNEMPHTFAEFMIITNRRYGDCPVMIIAPSERARDIYCRKGRGPGRFGSSTYSCGIKVGRLADRHGAGDGGKKREQKGPWRESRLFMTRGGARNPAIPVCLNSQGKRTRCDR